MSCGPTSTRCFRPHADRGTQIAAEGAAAPSTWGRPELPRFAAPPAHTWTAQLLWLLEGTAHKQCGGLPGLHLGLNLARSFTRIFRAVNRRIFSFFLEPSTLNPAHEIGPKEITRNKNLVRLYVPQPFRVWYHRSVMYEIRTEEEGGPEGVKELLRIAGPGRRRVEAKYVGPGELGPYTDFELGMLNGKLSALRWVLGSEWDFLDT